MHWGEKKIIEFSFSGKNYSFTSRFDTETPELTVRRLVLQTCPPPREILVLTNTPPASVHSPLHQMSAGNDSVIHCSFALNANK